MLRKFKCHENTNEHEEISENSWVSGGKNLYITIKKCHESTYEHEEISDYSWISG
jgi:hypothetical protein